MSLTPSFANIKDLLDTYQWNHRVIILMANDQSSSDLKQQQDVLSRKQPELEDRDLIIINAPRGKAYKGIPAEAFHKQYNPDNKPFMFVLLGKDGGVKLSSDTPVTTEKLFTIIDAMPMRRMEMLLD